jgi:hypothetical protein
MNTSWQRALSLSASALTALVLIWDEAPIANAPSTPSQVAAADAVAKPVRNERAGGAASEPSQAVVKGDRTGAGPAAGSARPVAPPEKYEGDRMHRGAPETDANSVGH